MCFPIFEEILAIILSNIFFYHFLSFLFIIVSYLL